MFKNNDSQKVHKKQLASKTEDLFYQMLIVVGYYMVLKAAMPHLMLLPKLNQFGQILIFVTSIAITIVFIIAILTTVKTIFELAVMYIHYKIQPK